MRLVPIRRSALLCSLVLLACVLISRPFVEVGINDDWSYIRTAFNLAQTGHVAYFGWTTPILGWQLYFGALFLKVLGLSFSVARFSVLLIAGATVYLLHGILLRCGVTKANATLGTLTFALSPLFVPLSFSFMSDVAGLFAILLCLNLCLRSLQADTDQAAANWLLLAIVANLIFGTARQTSWLGALVMVPTTYWLLERRPPLIKALLIWLTSAALIFACVKWFQHQPYTQQENPLDDFRNHESRYQIAETLIHFALSIPLFLLPILAGFITPALIRIRDSRTVAFIAVAGLLLLISTGAWLHHYHALMQWLAPFSPNSFTQQGLVWVPSIGTRPTVLGTEPRIIITLFVFFAAFAVATCIFDSAPTENQLIISLTHEPTPSGRTLFYLLAPFTVVYCCLLLPRGFVGAMFDRYLLPLLVVTIIALLRLHQQKVAPRLPALSVLCLVMGTIYSIASMHDLYAMERGRLTAANELRTAGVPRTSFYGGFGYDGWTQVDSWGYIRSPRLNLPPGPQRTPAWTITTKPCGYIFYRMFDAIHPQYALSFDPTTCDGPSTFAPVQYQTWLPPFNGRIYIQKVTAAQSWVANQ